MNRFGRYLVPTVCCVMGACAASGGFGGFAADGSGGSSGALLRVDGSFDDWTSVGLLATDPAGDASGAFDVTFVQAASRGTVLFLRFDVGSTVNLQAGSGGDGTLLVDIGFEDGGSVVVDTRDRSLMVTPAGGAPQSRLWSAADYWSAPTYADDEFELRLDLGLLGVAEGESVTVQFGGSDALSAPASFEMGGGGAVAERIPLGRAPSASFRVASLNTLWTGLLDPGQAGRIARLLGGVRADIYCLQEEWDSSASQVAAFLEAVDPFGDGASWNVVKDAGNVIASRGMLVPLPVFETGYVAAVVDMGGGDAVAVLSVHLKCCGYIGDSSDNRRISQTAGMIQTIEGLRSGAHGPAFDTYRDAPVVVIGDWNLVGSRTPLTMLEDPAGPALRESVLAHVSGAEVWTWRNTGSGFAPGRLDLVAHGGDLRACRGYVLDSGGLTVDELASLGVLAGDSDGASDHLVLVADFAFAGSCGGDANGDGATDVADLSAVVGSIGRAAVPGEGPDVDGDGRVGESDLAAVIAHYGCIVDVSP